MTVEGAKQEAVLRSHFVDPDSLLHQEVLAMTRDPEPITDEEFAAFEEAMEEQARELREALAKDLGGEPEDYVPRRRSVSASDE